jgi:putative tryptophan/tyrosine transport system substrate-binding protein
MKRREFLKIIAAAGAGWPAGSRGQPAPHLPEIGFLYAGNSAAGVSRMAAFLDGLRSKGYVEGRNITLVARNAESNSAQFEPLAKELIARKVRVLFASGPGVVRYAHAASDTIPLVAMDLESDPVKDRLVASIAHPGGNLTGLFFDFPEFSTKWLQLLREAVPGLSRLAILWDITTGSVQLDTLTAEAKSEGLPTEILKVKAPEDLEAAFQSAAARKADSLLVLSSPLFGTNPKAVADLALKYKLPAITLFPEFAQVGGLMAYGTNLIDLFFQSGVLVGKVLDGAKPQDLPVERPSRFQLVINLQTAKALGLAIPTSLLLRADQIIE